MRLTRGLALGVLVACASAAPAHYNMLLPASASARKGEAVVFTYQWGHPFEHQLFDAPRPHGVRVVGPDGKETNVKRLEEVSLPAGEGKKVTGYRFRFTPPQRGDYTFVLQTPPIWMEEDGEFLQDTVKVVLHVQAQKGWDHLLRDEFEAVPLTRPYGLEPGTVFQAQFTAFRRELGRPVQAVAAGTLVEVERYNAVAPKELPPDEFITRTIKTDPNGVATTTLTEAGWWCLTAARGAGELKRDGKSGPLRRRTTLWVFVDQKRGGK